MQTGCDTVPPAVRRLEGSAGCSLVIVLTNARTIWCATGSEAETSVVPASSCLCALVLPAPATAVTAITARPIA